MRFGTRLIVDLSLLADNFKKLRLLCPQNEILFMVKSDGYGHGMQQIVQYCLENNLCDEFGCATLAEALKLRSTLIGYQFSLYVFSETGLYDAKFHAYYLEKNIFPVISSMEDLKIFLANEDFKYFPLNLKINTGMNRLGIAVEDIDEVMKILKNKQRPEINHLMSHFACASQSVQKIKKNQNQYDQFLQIKKMFINNNFKLHKTSMANSGAIEQKFALDESHIRPGLILYGPSALTAQMRARTCWNGKNIARLETTVLKSFLVKKGDPLGYGATPCPAAGTILILSIGYGDGFATRYRGAVLGKANLKGKIVGRISMDMAHYLISGEQKSFAVGEKIILWGHSQSEFLEFCDQVNTIPYEVLCQLGSRIPRIYY